mmetsp:Transcript_16487/g.33298  ORF Transcript_16487/g.33298 Transcript_16487/m.33298 type:complete len:264 (+) Transcript_16487:646-1437(+)
MRMRRAYCARSSRWTRLSARRRGRGSWVARRRRSSTCSTSLTWSGCSPRCSTGRGCRCAAPARYRSSTHGSRPSRRAPRTSPPRVTTIRTAWTSRRSMAPASRWPTRRPTPRSSKVARARRGSCRSIWGPRGAARSSPSRRYRTWATRPRGTRLPTSSWPTTPPSPPSRPAVRESRASRSSRHRSPTRTPSPTRRFSPRWTSACATWPTRCSKAPRPLRPVPRPTLAAAAPAPRSAAASPTCATASACLATWAKRRRCISGQT